MLAWLLADCKRNRRSGNSFEGHSGRRGRLGKVRATRNDQILMKRAIRPIAQENHPAQCMVHLPLKSGGTRTRTLGMERGASAEQELSCTNCGSAADQKFPSQNSVELDSEVLTRILRTVQETRPLSSFELPIASASRRPIM